MWQAYLQTEGRHPPKEIKCELFQVSSVLIDLRAFFVTLKSGHKLKNNPKSRDLHCQIFIGVLLLSFLIKAISTSKKMPSLHKNICHREKSILLLLTLWLHTSGLLLCRLPFRCLIYYAIVFCRPPGAILGVKCMYR